MCLFPLTLCSGSHGAWLGDGRLVGECTFCAGTNAVYLIPDAAHACVCSALPLGSRDCSEFPYWSHSLATFQALVASPYVCHCRQRARGFVPVSTYDDERALIITSETDCVLAVVYRAGIEMRAFNTMCVLPAIDQCSVR